MQIYLELLRCPSPTRPFTKYGVMPVKTTPRLSPHWHSVLPLSWSNWQKTKKKHVKHYFTQHKQEKTQNPSTLVYNILKIQAWQPFLLQNPQTNLPFHHTSLHISLTQHACSFKKAQALSTFQLPNFLVDADNSSNIERRFKHMANGGSYPQYITNIHDTVLQSSHYRQPPSTSIVMSGLSKGWGTCSTPPMGWQQTKTVHGFPMRQADRHVTHVLVTGQLFKHFRNSNTYGQSCHPS